MWWTFANRNDSRWILNLLNPEAIVSVFDLGMPIVWLLSSHLYCGFSGKVHLWCGLIAKAVAALEVFILILRMLTYASLAIIFLQFTQRLGRTILFVVGAIAVCLKLEVRVATKGREDGLEGRCVEPAPLDCWVLRCGEGAIEVERFFISY